MQLSCQFKYDAKVMGELQQMKQYNNSHNQLSHVGVEQ